MFYKQYYGNLIWTNHAIERMKARGLSQDMAKEAFSHPDKTFPGKTYGSFEYQKQFGSSRATLIAKQNDKYEWIVLSAWIDPPLSGSGEAAGFWGKMWLTLKKQLTG